MKVRNRKVKWPDADRRQYQAAARKIDREEKADILDEAREMLARQKLLLDAMTRLKACRQHEGLSLTDLSHLTGIPKANLSRLEAGKANPTLETLVRYAGAMHLTLKLDIAA
ncbi:MAG: helix-turn-helix transcriptional regulator [Phycisphaeraceae bacterium]